VVVAFEAFVAVVCADDMLMKWTACPENPVLRSGAQGAWDENIRERMWVIFEDGKFHAWYGGWKGPYCQMQHKLVQLGYATSTDGVHWKRHRDNPIFADRWVEDMCVVRSGDTYFMYAEDESYKKTVIHLLTSPDKIHWTPQGNVLEKVPGSNWEANWVGTPLVWKEGTQWYMLYEGGGPGDIALALSSDGRNWSRDRNNPVLPNAPGPAWDDQVTAGDSVIKLGNVYYLFYHAIGTVWQTGIATSSDLVHWTRFEGNPISKEHSAVVVDVGDKYFLYTWDGVHRGAVNLYMTSK
jgi:hypothetical protein